LDIVAQLFEVELRLSERQAPGRGLFGLLDDPGDVQERLRRNAAAIETHSTQARVGIDERGLEPMIGGENGGGVAARAAADHEHLRLTDAVAHGAVSG
jgi:hypothetical protein